MEDSAVRTRTLIVDDYQPWRGYVATVLQTQVQLQIIGEAADGFEAVQAVEGLQPDLILLDIVLPRLNGIQAARKIRQLSPKTKILFVSVEAYLKIVQESFRAGGHGYLLKSDAGSELLLAIQSVLADKRFVSKSVRFSERLIPRIAAERFR
jgi:DNA-binding NarL/FixJ family response regulator